ncbi:MAG: hypothetical protein ACXWVQ_01325 [Methyloceanibacter sp.]
MTSNVHKRLDKLKKEITQLGAKRRSFHYIVGDANESAEAKLGRLKAEGTVQAGDEIQIVQVPWVINALKGNRYISEGSAHDPLEDPGLPPPTPIATSWAEQREREERWKKHERKIEADGERYEGDKTKDTTWR